MTTQSDIRSWIERGKQKKNISHLVVACDTYDHEDYPIFVEKNQNLKEIISEHSGKNMQRVMEVYNYQLDLESQLSEMRSWHDEPFQE